MLENDSRPVHIKLAKIAGQFRFITVLPPAEQKQEDVVWAFRKPHDTQRLNPMVYDGPSSLSDYAASKLDHAN